TPLREGGKLSALAVTTAQRVPGVDLPTMAEAAHISGFDIAPVWGVLLPAGAPAPIIARLESWFAQISKMDAMRQFLAVTHGAPFAGGAADLRDFIPKEIEKWRELSKLAKIEPQWPISPAHPGAAASAWPEFPARSAAASLRRGRRGR